MSRDGGRVAFATWVGGKNVVFLDGRPGEPFDSVSWPLALSDDGSVVAYAARLGGEQFCVAGGGKSAPYKTVSPPVVSADGKTVAFAASDGSRWYAVMNGERGPAFDWVGNLSLHASGHPLAYAAESHAEGHRAFVVFEGRQGPTFDRVTRPVLSGDGRRVAYGGRRNGRWFLISGDREQPVENEIASVFVSRDGSLAGYVVEAPGRARVVAPNAPGQEFDWVGWPTFLPDGRPFYLAARGRMKFLVAGRETVELGEGIVWDPVLSADGSRIGFGARFGRKLVWKVMPLPASGGDRGTLGKGEKP